MFYECNECGKEFEYSEGMLEKLVDGQYEVQYFTCPYCGKRYQVLTIDDQMRMLVMQRRKIGNLLRVYKTRISKGISVHQKHVLKAQKEDRRLKNEQMKLLADLKKKGEELLAKMDAPEAKTDESQEDKA